MCLTPKEYNDFVIHVKELINDSLREHPKQYHHIKVSIRSKLLTVRFAEDESGPYVHGVSFTGSKDSTKKSDFKVESSYRYVYPKMYQVIRFIKDRLGVSRSDDYNKLFNSKDEVFKYFEELPHNEEIPHYNESINTTENTGNNYTVYGLAGLSTTLLPVLHNITTSGSGLISTAKVEDSIQQNNTLDESSNESIYITTAVIFSAFIFLIVGFVSYKCCSQRKRNLNNNPSLSVIATDQVEQNLGETNVSIQEGNQISIASEVQLISGEESRRSITQAGDEQSLSSATGDQESETSSQRSITSSTGSRSSLVSTGSKQQQLSSQEITAESSEDSAESSKSSLEEVKVVESNQKPKPRSIYLNVCQC